MQIRKLIVSSFKKGDRYDSCADPGIFRQFGGGGGVGRVQVHLAYKKSSDNVFLFLFFFVLNLFYRSPVVTFKENYYLPRFQWGWNIFQGSNFLQGVQLLFPYRNPYNL